MSDGCFYSYRAADVNPLVLECRSIRICHGRTRNFTEFHGRKNTAFRAGCVSDGCFYSYRAADVNPLVLECRSICHGLTRNFTERRTSRSICHGISRKRQKQRHGRKNKQKHLPRKQNTAFRAGCVSDGCIHFFPMITLL